MAPKEEILRTTFVGKRILLCNTGTANDEMVRRYIEGQQIEGDEVFEIKE